uniref:Reelin domain-containing protein n=1 Tax=Romanomermis culicivorax TaxID=13658 RepID=A0A915KZ70_ROMCU
MQNIGILIILINLSNFCYQISDHKNDQIEIPCSAQHSMKIPNYPYQPQSPSESPPPYQLIIVDKKGQATTKRYRVNETYDIVLTSSDTVSMFTAFVIQARLATRQGFLIGHLRAGEFLHSPSWSTQGVKIQECEP